MCIRDSSKGVYLAYTENNLRYSQNAALNMFDEKNTGTNLPAQLDLYATCLLYTSDAADERSSVDLGGRRIIKKKKTYRHSNTKTHNKSK